MSKWGCSKMILGVLLLSSLSNAQTVDEQSVVTALRLSNTITGGTLTTDNPLFKTMVDLVQSGDIKGAANIASTSKYFTNYLARRLALQMQNPNLDETAADDNDGTTFLIAHFVGGPKTGPTWKPSISTIWSENQSYLVTVPIVTGSLTVMMPEHIEDVPALTKFSIHSNNIDWSAQIVQGGKQQAWLGSSLAYPALNKKKVEIPDQHVGGYITSSWGHDNSLASFGASLGTNLRYIEAVWEISTGLGLTDFEDTNYASTDELLAEAVPRFVPDLAQNPNFLQGQGQSACIACHGGGLSSLKHGYATVADVFDYNALYGFLYNDSAAENHVQGYMKSLGSTGNNRVVTGLCNQTKNPGIPCNVASPGVDPNQAWDISSWEATAIWPALGWTGNTQGTGLKQLGIAIGQASIVYEVLTKRIIKEICPVGMFSTADVANIAYAANPNSGGTDDLRTIVNLVASNPTCR